MRLKRSISWLALAAVLVAVLLGWKYFQQSSQSGAGSSSAAITARPSTPIPEVPIQDGKTIDFSSGKPVVKDSAEEKAVIDAAVKEMEAASKEVTSSPAVVPPKEEKPVDPAALPPKP